MGQGIGQAYRSTYRSNPQSEQDRGIPFRGRWWKRKTHGPVPTVLNAKASNPRFLLSVNPQAAGSPLTAIPKSAELSQNYPNPFNPKTVIRYGVPGEANVQLSIYDLLGRKVCTPINEQKTTGRYEVNFNGSRLASGLYFYKLKIGAEVLTKKMMLIK